MKKQKMRLAAALLALLLTVGLMPSALAAGGPVSAKAGNIDLRLNGTDMKLGTYNIANNNYVKLRDVAQLLAGTGKGFSVTWNGAAQRIDLTSGAAYQPEGGELAPLAAGQQMAAPSAASVWLDGKPVRLTAYTINGNNFFKLRDLGFALNFCVTWEADTGVVAVDTTRSYVSEHLAQQTAIAQMLAQCVLDELDNGRTIDTYLVDLDGDGIKEVAAYNGGWARLYCWQDGQAVPMWIGGVAGGSTEWWLCRDTATGELGIEFIVEGGGDFSGSTSTFYYLSHEASINDHFGYGDTEITYSVGHESVTKAVYDAARAQHQRLVQLFTQEEQFGAHTVETLTELKAMIEGN